MSMNVEGDVGHKHVVIFGQYPEGTSHCPPARLSGVELDDEDLEEVEKLEELESVKELDLWTRIKKGIFDLVQRMGFFGILVCASVISRFLSYFMHC